jgi:hypothetical protein
MEPTPINLDANGDLLKVMPFDAGWVVEVGCSGGGLAREYRKLNPRCQYTGIEISEAFAKVARAHCTRVLVDNIERMSDEMFQTLAGSDCWVFGDVLEHLNDPWAVLRRIRSSLASVASVVACIPNAQHWSIQAALNCGHFRYQDRGLMDRTHIRWFTREGIDEMFASCGYAIVDGLCRILDEPYREAALVGVRAFAETIGADPDKAAADATPLQYVVRAVPI